jgi:hypothetical protein
MTEFETATADGSRVIMLGGERIRGTFPRSWGTPPGDLDERERWMRRNIGEDESRLNRGEKAEGQRVRTGRQALAAIERMRRVDAEQMCTAEANEWMRALEANHARLRMLELKREGPR